MFLKFVVVICIFAFVASFSRMNGCPSPPHRPQFARVFATRTSSARRTNAAVIRPLPISGVMAPISRRSLHLKDADLQPAGDTSDNRIPLISGPIGMYLLNVVKGKNIRKNRVNIFIPDFQESSYIGDDKQLGELLRWAATVGQKPRYLGTLKGRGMGKSAMCEKMCQLSIKLGVLPVCVDFKYAPDVWGCVPLSLMDDVRNIIHFSLSLVARMLYDRFDFETVYEAIRLMEANYYDTLLTNQPDAHTLIETAVKLIRSNPNGPDSKKVLIIVDESAEAVKAWPLSQGGLMSILRKSTVNRRVDGISLFMTGLKFEAFDSDITKSKMKSVSLRPLNPEDIREKWLKLNCSDTAVKDLTTRFLGVLASTPRVICEMKNEIQEFANQRKSEASTARIGKLMDRAASVFSCWYGGMQKSQLKHVTLDVLNGLIMGKEIRLSRPVLDLVATSFLVNDVRVENPEMENNDIIPESSLFILKEMQLTSSPASREEIMLDGLKRFSSLVVNDLLGIDVAVAHGKIMETIYPRWLEVKLNCAAQSRFTNGNQISVLNLLGVHLTTKKAFKTSHVEGTTLDSELTNRDFHDHHDLALLQATQIPPCGSGVYVYQEKPRFTTDTSRGNDPLVTELEKYFPSEKIPLKLIPQTGKGEHFDSLLLIHRPDESLGPLIIAFDYKQSMEALDFKEAKFKEGNRFILSDKYLDQQRLTTEYFDNLKKRPGSRKFEFIYVFVTSKQAKFPEFGEITLDDEELSSEEKLHKDEEEMHYFEDASSTPNTSQNTIVLCRGAVRKFLTPTVWRVLQGTAPL